MKKLITIIIVASLALTIQAQDITNTPGTNGNFEVVSTTGGMLIPRMTEVQRDAISSPATGLMIYQTDNTSGFYHYDGTAWVSFTGATAINDLTDAKTSGYSTGTPSIYLGEYAGNIANSIYNTAIGAASLAKNTGTVVSTDGHNTAIGYRSGTEITTGGFNIMLGYNTEPSAHTASHELNIGNVIYGNNIYNPTGNIGIGHGNNAPDASSVLDIKSTTAGLLIPRMTQDERDAIVSPAKSLLIYQYAGGTVGFYYNAGTTASPFWQLIADDNGTPVTAIDDLSDAKTGDFSLYLGTVPGGITATAEQNTVIGINAGSSLTDGKMNILIGKEAGGSINTGNDNILLTIGDAGISTGSGNILIGKYPTYIASGTTDNQMNIGDAIFATGMTTPGVKVGIGNGNNAPSSTLDVNGEHGYDQLRLQKNYTPTSGADTNGSVGDVAWDDDYFYVKTNTGWKRTALATW